MVALQFVAVVLAQEGDLLFGLDALGDDPEVELLAERDDRGGDRAVVLVVGKILDERRGRSSAAATGNRFSALRLE